MRAERHRSVLGILMYVLVHCGPCAPRDDARLASGGVWEGNSCCWVMPFGARDPHVRVSTLPSLRSAQRRSARIWRSLGREVLLLESIEIFA